MKIFEQEWNLILKHCVITLCWWTHWTFPSIIYNSKIANMIKMICLFEEERDKNNSNYNCYCIIEAKLFQKYAEFYLQELFYKSYKKKNKFESSRHAICSMKKSF